MKLLMNCRKQSVTLLNDIYKLLHTLTNDNIDTKKKER